MECRTDKVTFYISYGESGKLLPDDERLKFYDSIIDYSFWGIEPKIENNTVLALFLCVKPNIDKSIETIQKGRINGRKGGAPKGNQNAKKAESGKTTLGLNENKANKDNDKDIERENEQRECDCHEREDGQGAGPNIDFEKLYN